MNTESARPRPIILCVDDEPRVLEGLALHLRKEYEIHSALSGKEALDKLRELKRVSVVIADMRMPGMDGATLLAQVMSSYPDVTRVLLTGEPGRESAVSAVNKGHVFQFLTKPCGPDQLRAAVEAGVVHHRVLTAERTILQETVLGCIKALVDVLALANPVVFGRASRIKRIAMDFSAALATPEYWQLEAAAMLSQIGYLSMPADILERAYYGESLTADESATLREVPAVAIRLLEHIPRLEPVLQILNALQYSDAQVSQLGEGTIGLATRILGMVLEYDRMTVQGVPSGVAVQTLKARTTRYGESLIAQFAAHVGAEDAQSAIAEVALRVVQPGMTLQQDLRTHTGTLLVPRGFEVTVTFLERIRNYGPELLAQKVKVLVSTRPAHS